LFVVVHNQHSVMWYCKLLVCCCCTQSTISHIVLIVYNNKQTRSLQYNMTECWFCTTTNKLEVYSTTWLNVDSVQQQQTRTLQYNMTECWFCTTTNKLEVYSFSFIFWCFFWMFIFLLWDLIPRDYIYNWQFFPHLWYITLQRLPY
jgi:hypothetical protein